MRKSKFIDSQIMDAVKRVEAGFGGPLENLRFDQSRSSRSNQTH